MLKSVFAAELKYVLILFVLANGWKIQHYHTDYELGHTIFFNFLNRNTEW